MEVTIRLMHISEVHSLGSWRHIAWKTQHRLCFPHFKTGNTDNVLILRISCKTRLVEAVLSLSESDILLHGSIRHGMKHSTVAKVGRGSEVEQLVQGVVVVGLDGVDVLVVGVVGVHHHMQLTAWEKCNTTQVRDPSPASDDLHASDRWKPFGPYWPNSRSL